MLACVCLISCRDSRNARSDSGPDAKLSSETHDAPKSPERIDIERMVANIRNQKLLTLKAELFSIPLSEEAERDRDEAWRKLDVPNYPEEYLTSSQYKYACELLDKYSTARPLDKLVFWWLVRIQQQNSSPSGISIQVGEYSSRKTSDKLREVLYSALGKSPDTLTYNAADDQAMSILNEAVRKAKPHP